MAPPSSPPSATPRRRGAPPRASARPPPRPRQRPTRRDDPSDDAAPRSPSTFLSVVTLGNIGSDKSAVLNSLIRHPVLPTGENGATRAPIVVDLQRDLGLNTKSIVLQIDNKLQQVSSSVLRHSLQDRLSKATGHDRSRTDEIYLKLWTSTAPPLKLIDLPSIDQRVIDDSTMPSFSLYEKMVFPLIEEALA